MADIFETTDAAAGTATTFTLPVGQVVQGMIGTGGDHDWYRVNLTAGQTYTFAMRGTGTNDLVDTYLRLRNSAGTELLASDDEGPGMSSVITFTATTSGTYYLDASAYNTADGGQYGLSATLGARAHYDVTMGAAALDTNTSWSATPGVGTTVTFGFRANAPGYTVNGHPTIQSTFAPLTTQEMTAVRSAMQMWSELSGLTLSEVNPGGYTNNATILLSNYTDPNDGSGAFAFYPGSTATTASEGDVFLNTTSVSTTALPQGSYSFYTVLHEIGHALGLSHPGEYNAAPGVQITYANSAQFIQDSQQYTVMSYFDESATGANAGGYADTPMLHDIYALQQLYGANMATRAGNTTYGFGSTAGSVYDFAVNTTPALCIWDGGGIDMLNCSGFSQNQTIDLNAGAFSHIGGLTSNVSIAFGATIENAQGGSGADIIRGNAIANALYGNGGADQLFGNGGDDVLVGGAGKDTIDGGTGFDTAVYGGTAAQYRTLAFGGSLVVASGAEGGAEMLSNVERVQFTDLTTTGFTSSYNYIASHGDLINALGPNGMAGLHHFAANGYAEGRQVTFDGLDYIASHGDLTNAIGVNDAGGALHYIQFGFREGRQTTFNGIEYVASHNDLMNAFGANDDAGATHFLQYGRFEGRKATFNGLEYIASHNDLSNAFGANDDAGARHFIQFGRNEGRHTTFDGNKYIASYGDLINAFHASDDAGAAHFIQYGRFEGRTATFDAASYLANYADLQAAFGNNHEAATIHYINYGYYEGRDWS